jgi:hypothetical protein
MADVQEEEKAQEENGNTIVKSPLLKSFTVASIIIFVIFLIAGLLNLLDETPPIVGGDAFNYMINAGKAAACFIVSFGALIAGILIDIDNTLNS